MTSAWYGILGWGLFGLTLLSMAAVVLVHGRERKHRFQKVKGRQRWSQRRAAEIVAKVPKNGHGRFINSKGMRIATSSWGASAQRGVVLFLHGLGEHADMHDEFARFLAENGFTVYALDHQGHGRSEGDRLFVSSFNDFVDDVLQLTDIVLKQEGIDQVWLAGFSMGGAIALRAALADKLTRFCGILVGGPGLELAAPQILQAATHPIARMFPKLRVFRADPNLLSSDTDLLDYVVNDPLFRYCHETGLSAKLTSELIRNGHLVQRRAASIQIPLLILHGKQDGMIRITGSNKLFDRVSSQDKRFITLEGFQHAIFNQATSKTAVWPVVLEWLTSRSSV